MVLDESLFLKITTKKRPAFTPAMPLLTTGCQWVGGDKIDHPVHYISAPPPKILNGFLQFFVFQEGYSSTSFIRTSMFSAIL